MFKNILLAVLLVMLSACTSTGMSLSDQDNAYQTYVAENNIEELDKINSFSFHGWQSLTYSHLIISSRVNDKYLIELSGYCADLMYTNSILITQRNRTTLMSKFDAIRVADKRQIKCQIKSIYQLTKAQVEEISQIGKEPIEQTTKKVGDS